MADSNLSVILEKVGNQPLKTTKILCQELGLGLADAKAMVDRVPTTVATKIAGDKALALAKELEAVGNTVSIPGMEMKAEASATEKLDGKKRSTKKSAPSPLTAAVPANEEFDAIFGVRSASKTTAPAKSKDSVKTAPKAKADNVSAAPNDEFDAIFGKGK